MGAVGVRDNAGVSIHFRGEGEGEGDGDGDGEDINVRKVVEDNEENEVDKDSEKGAENKKENLNNEVNKIDRGEENRGGIRKWREGSRVAYSLRCPLREGECSLGPQGLYEECAEESDIHESLKRLAVTDRRENCDLNKNKNEHYHRNNSIENQIGNKNENESVSITRLIPANSPHSGASAFYLDGAFSSAFLLRLDELYSVLPVAAAERGAGECASRAYFCDAMGWVTDGLAEALKHLTSAASNKCSEIENWKRKSGHDYGDGDDDSGISGNNNDFDIFYPATATATAADAEHSEHTDNRHTLHTPHTPVTRALAHMRFLRYSTVGASSPPHIDLSRRVNGQNSTHTFLLYLTDCEAGGETRLLRAVNPKCIKGPPKAPPKDPLNDPLDDPLSDPLNDPLQGPLKCSKAKNKHKLVDVDSFANIHDDLRSNVLATISPRRGRLLVFPHSCPHEGASAVSLPKILLRGEMMA